MEGSRSEVWLLQYVGTSIQISMVLSSLERNKHRKREVKLMEAAYQDAKESLVFC